MANGNRRARTRPHDEDQAPTRLRMWLDANDDLMAGLVRLRELRGSERAVRAVLAVPELQRLRLSWQLWESLVLGDGDDPDRLLLGRVPLAALEQARLALYGVELGAPPTHLSLVEPQ
jgi:hypothetical protein